VIKALYPDLAERVRDRVELDEGIGALRDSATLCERASQYLRVGTMPTLCVSGDCESPMRVTH
jgi:hypothetical protein